MRKSVATAPVIEGDRQVGTINSLPEQSQWTTTLTTHAVQYIKDHRKQPFFLYLAHPLPHVPLAVSEKFKGKSELDYSAM